MVRGPECDETRCIDGSNIKIHICSELWKEMQNFLLFSIKTILHFAFEILAFVDFHKTLHKFLYEIWQISCDINANVL